jgi:hypothetical protein
MVTRNNLYRFASLLSAAVMLFSCSGTIDPGDGLGGGENNGNVDNSGTGNNGGGQLVPKELVVTADKKFVQTFDGDFVTLTVTLGEETLTDGVTFYDADDNEIPVENFKFMTDKAGEHKIFAAYGTYFSQPVTVTAVAVAIPESPLDKSPENVNFRPRVLMTQFTTTGCSYCPQMKILLKKALTGDYLEKVVKVDCHSLIINNRNDPAYVDLEDFQDQCRVSGLPSVNLDMNQTDGNYLMPTIQMQEYIDSWIAFKDGKAAGISVNSVSTDSQIVTKVTVKAAETGTYRVGLMLLEDNIVADPKLDQTQLGSGVEDWMNTHNSVVRYMDSKYPSGSGFSYYGHSLGEIAKGATSDYLFILDLPSIWDAGSLKAEHNKSTWAKTWVKEELHLAVFVTTVGTDGKNEFYYVSNVVDCPIDGETPFEYK